VPLSNIVSEANRGRAHPAQRNFPFRCSFSSELLPARSVPSCRSTSYAAGERSFFYSASVFSTS
jgi:hypothetical protein